MVLANLSCWGRNLGHMLVIPVRHSENMYDLPDEDAYAVQAMAKRVAMAMKHAYGCDGVSTRQHNEPAGNQDVWHYHLHVVPRWTHDELYLQVPRLTDHSERAPAIRALREALGTPKTSVSRHVPDGYVCPFCQIVRNGVGPETNYADIVWQDRHATAFVGSRWWPDNAGHVIIVPNAHWENLYELPDALGGYSRVLARRIGLAMKDAYGCDGVSTRQHNEPAGNQEVWHYHLHVFPRYYGDQLYTQMNNWWTPPADTRAQYASLLRQVLKW
jgi:histidine triad (HIT) family protein